MVRVYLANGLDKVAKVATTTTYADAVALSMKLTQNTGKHYIIVNK